MPVDDGKVDLNGSYKLQLAAVLCAMHALLSAVGKVKHVQI